MRWRRSRYRRRGADWYRTGWRVPILFGRTGYTGGTRGELFPRRKACFFGIPFKKEARRGSRRRPSGSPPGQPALRGGNALHGHEISPDQCLEAGFKWACVSKEFIGRLP